MKKIFEEIFDEQKNNMDYLLESGYLDSVQVATVVMVNALKNGNKILLAGNGGSAADAQHFAGELVGRFLKERDGLPAISLTTDSSVMTCIGNDYGYDALISRQIEALGKKGDVFLGISTSGNSQNIINAVKVSKEKGLITIGLLGKDGGKLKDMCDYNMLVGLKATPRIQEFHIMTVHMMCEMIENKVFEE